MWRKPLPILNTFMTCSLINVFKRSILFRWWNKCIFILKKCVFISCSDLSNDSGIVTFASWLRIDYFSWKKMNQWINVFTWYFHIDNMSKYLTLTKIKIWWIEYIIKKGAWSMKKCAQIGKKEKKYLLWIFGVSFHHFSYQMQFSKHFLYED